MSGLGVSCSRCARCPQAPPDEQPDEVFAVAQSGGAVKWACAQYAKAWDGAENSGWSRIATEAANRTVWMKYSSPNGTFGVVRRILMDPTLSVLLAAEASAAPSEAPLQPLPDTVPPAGGPNVGLIVGLTLGLCCAAVLATIAAVLVNRRRLRDRSRAMSLQLREVDRKNAELASVGQH